MGPTGYQQWSVLLQHSILLLHSCLLLLHSGSLLLLHSGSLLLDSGSLLPIMPFKPIMPIVATFQSYRGRVASAEELPPSTTSRSRSGSTERAGGSRGTGTGYLPG